MLRMIQGIDQRLDALLCGRMLSDGKGVFLGVMSENLVARSRALVDEALSEFNLRGGIQLSLNRDDNASVVDSDAGASVKWRYWLEIDGVRDRFYIELLDGANFVLRFVDHCVEVHTKITYFNASELSDGRGFKSKLFWCFENVIGWLRYEDAFVASWNEFSRRDERVSTLSVRALQEGVQLGSDALDEFTFKYNSQDRFFIELTYDDRTRKLCVQLGDTRRSSYWRNFFLGVGESVAGIMPELLDIAEAWSKR